METPLEMSATTMNCFTCASGICSDRFFATRYEHTIADPAKSAADRNFTFPFLKCAVLTAKFVNTVAKSAVPQILCTSISVIPVRYADTNTPPPTPTVPCSNPHATPSASISRSPTQRFHPSAPLIVSI